MKKSIFCLLAAGAVLAGCNKASENVPQEETKMIHKTFSVTSDETKTHLDGMAVKWSEGDKINVIAESGAQYTFTLASGANTNKAVFEGKIEEADAEGKFYAVYPDVNVSVNGDIIEFLPSSDGNHVKYFDSETTPVVAIKDGFDSRYAPMTAVAAGDEFSFRHGVAFFKIKVTAEEVKTIKLESSNARFNGRPKYNIEDGTTNVVESAKPTILAEPLSGTFEAGAVYYIPVLTSPEKKVRIFTITYTKEDGTSASLSTNSLSDVQLESGLVYDLGEPPVRFAEGGDEPVTPHTYIFYMDNATVVQTEDGEPGASYFTITGTSTLKCSASGYFGVDSFEILTKNYNYAKKIDGSNAFSFVARRGVASKLRFFAANRQEAISTIKLKAGGSNIISDNMTYKELYDSGEVTLTPGTTYSFDKSGEVGIFYVQVVESVE